MGLIDFDLYSWKVGPHVFLYILVAILGVIFLSTILMMMAIDPFFFPGLIMMLFTLWLLVGALHWIRKLEGYHYRIYGIKPENCVGIVENALKDLDLEWEEGKDRVDLIFFWTANFDKIFHLSREGIDVCFRNFSIGQATGIYIGRESPSNIELIIRIMQRIDEATAFKITKPEES